MFLDALKNWGSHAFDALHRASADPIVRGGLIGAVVFVFFQWAIRWWVRVLNESYLEDEVRPFIRTIVREYWEEIRQAQTRDRTTREERQAELQAEQIRDALRTIVVEAQNSGIPIQVNVTSQREADLIAQVAGVIPLSVAKARKPRASNELTLPAAPNNEAMSVWDRLSSDESDEDEADPPEDAGETEEVWPKSEKPKTPPRKRVRVAKKA